MPPPGPVVVVVGGGLVVAVPGAVVDVVVVVAGASAVGAEGPTMYGPPMPVPDGRRCVPGSMPVRAAFEILSAMTLIGAGSENSVAGTSFRAGPMNAFHVLAGRQPPTIAFPHPR